MDNGDFVFTARGSVVTAEGLELYRKLTTIQREWNIANQDRLPERPFELWLKADEETLRNLPRNSA